MARCKTAIVLLGKPNSGKTATLREVARRLIATPGAVVKSNSRCLKWLCKTGADITVVVEVNGKVVLVRSCGDDEHEIVYTLELMTKYRCDIAVFALSLPKKDGGRKAVYRYYVNNKISIAANVVEMSKVRAEAQESIEVEVNKSADEIITALWDAIKK